MDRELELYSPEGEILAALTGAQVSAVPAITASHPRTPAAPLSPLPIAKANLGNLDLRSQR